MLLAERLNSEVKPLVRWCTPSIATPQVRTRDVYGSDICVSFRSLGSLIDHSKAFRHLVRRVRSAYRAGGSLISVNGSTGSNWIVARMFSLGDVEVRNEVLVERKPLVLVAQNCHHSVLN